MRLVDSIEKNMPYLLDRVMGEASLYAPQTGGAGVGANGWRSCTKRCLLLRAYRSTQPRLAYAKPVTDKEMLAVRRISAAFKDIPGGQILGPTLDYSHRLLRVEVLDEGVKRPFPPP